MVPLDEPTRPDHVSALFVEVGRREDLTHVPGTSAGLGGKLVAKELRHAPLPESLSNHRERIGFSVGTRETCGEGGTSLRIVRRLEYADQVAANGRKCPMRAPVVEVNHVTHRPKVHLSGQMLGGCPEVWVENQSQAWSWSDFLTPFSPTTTVCRRNGRQVGTVTARDPIVK
jgi:hypothetical protein